MLFIIRDIMRLPVARQLRMESIVETHQIDRQTQHASKRLQQRGVTFEVLALHEQYADKECFVGNGCISRTLSNMAIEEMKFMGVNWQHAEKVRKMAVIYTPADRICTVLFLRPGHGRTYRRGTRKRYRG